jgi:hypothetical protein
LMCDWSMIVSSSPCLTLPRIATSAKKLNRVLADNGQCF